MEVAIIGASVRLPGGVSSLLALQEFLSANVDAFTLVPPFQRGWTAHQGVGAFLQQDHALADCEFFKMSQREMLSGDPQQHLLLELAWEAVESSGILPSIKHENVGVLVGVSDLGRASPSYDPLFQYSSHAGVIAGKIANFFGFTGPALTLDTETSSALVCVHQAMQSLKLGEATITLAGGASLLQSSCMSQFYQKAHILSKCGKCRPFDRRGDGVVRGEGGGFVVLKLLKSCTAGDRILAVLSGSAVNQNGEHGDMKAPSAKAQETLLRSVLTTSGITIDDIDFVECHGTGTRAGDVAELAALEAVFSQRLGPIRIGSIKRKIGHLEAASGIAGLLKCIVSAMHLQIPAHDPDFVPCLALPKCIQVPTCTQGCSNKQMALCVVSLGLAGTNAAVVVRSNSVVQQPSFQSKIGLLTLSARSFSELRGVFRDLEGCEDADPLEVALLSNLYKKHFSWRVGHVVTSDRNAFRFWLAGQVNYPLPCYVPTNSQGATLLFLPDSPCYASC
eukprot:CAMPEP_0174244772 /NCGR_PEP_ID=MMETSP0417-20130205/36578_1 /TAXON_ID=242541 /ORGANISM="Mayorella sp, Strain BSH-02190019" /LENGTH=505 /DNA_ID=CAMNT_0015324495 /DNA_START=92 /DNA_END=1606 /DNA_ORIENTATION=+